jgi:hypothetical protein
VQLTAGELPRTHQGCGEEVKQLRGGVGAKSGLEQHASSAGGVIFDCYPLHIPPRARGGNKLGVAWFFSFVGALAFRLTCPVPQDEFIARIAAGVTRLDAEGKRFIPGWQWSRMVRTAAATLQAFSSFTSEEAANVPGHAQEELRIALGYVEGHLQNCLAEPLVRRSGNIRNFVQGPGYEDDLPHLLGSARFVTTHMLGIKEGGETGIDAMVVSSMQKLDSTIFQTPGVVCMFYFKAQEVNNCLVLVTEYTSAQDAYCAASRFNLLLNEIAPFIMDPVADNTSLVEGDICV